MNHSAKERQSGSTADSANSTLDALIVGAGFAGMYMLYRLRQLGLNVLVVEQGDGVGGTWYWNRYPGARCDVESMEYSYDFSEALQQDWEWSERFAAQPEILNYANHVADRFELRSHIRFSTTVISAQWQDSAEHWQIAAADGARWTARFCIMATGCLSSANLPDIPGRDEFAGRVYHTGQWPREGVDFTHRRVAIIGTGSSAIQSIPIVAEQARTLTVFQRTATYSIPARNAPLDAAHVAAVKADYPAFRAQNRLMPAAFGARFRRGDRSALEVPLEAVHADLEQRWQDGGFGFLGGFNDFMINADANALAAEFVRNKIRSIVHNPATAELLCPDQIIGCKRLCFDSGYYATFNRSNVHLVSVKERPIERITKAGLITNGVEYVVDDLIYATGFDAMTGSLLKIDIRGRDGQTLADKWSAGPRNYLGLSVEGFPNLFTVTGPGSPSVLANMIMATQQHVDWIADCIEWLNATGHHWIEAEEQAEDVWVGHVNAIASHTLYPSCNSWYLGANVPGKPRVFMPHLGFPGYVERCEQVVADAYAGFATG